MVPAEPSRLQATRIGSAMLSVVACRATAALRLTLVFALALHVATWDSRTRVKQFISFLRQLSVVLALEASQMRTYVVRHLLQEQLAEQETWLVLTEQGQHAIHQFGRFCVSKAGQVQ